MNDILTSRAPVRILDLGGWTDTWFCKSGAVLNFAIDRYSYVKLIPNYKNKIRIKSENLNIRTEMKDFRNIKYNGNLDLLKAAIKKLQVREGLDITVKTEVHPGSGTGTSASVAVALIHALSVHLDKPLNTYQTAKLAHKLETEELHLESGVQDQFAAAYGGINFMKVDYPEVTLTSLELKDSIIEKINNCILLVYLNPHSSSDIHKYVLKNFIEKDKNTLEAFEILRMCPYKMKEALLHGKIEKIPEIMNLNWNAQKNLHPLVTNNQIKLLEKIVFTHGGLGFKCNGAGGGGSATIFTNEIHKK
ncbi:MAG: hypothetical protein P8Y70_18080 [Candidatus Lokiarchaeota archaeon]